MARSLIHLAFLIMFATGVGLGSKAFAGMPDERRTDPVPQALQRAKPGARTSGVIRRQDDVAISVAHIEATQSIQDFEHTVPLLAGRGIYVRVFLTIGGATANADSALVSGRLSATLPSGNAITLDSLYRDLEPRVHGSQNGNLDAQRSDALSGLVFLLPAEAIAPGQIRLRLDSVQERDGQRQTTCSNCNEAERTIVVAGEAPTFRVHVIGISYTYNGALYEPRPLDLAMIPSWLRRAYPIATLVYETRVLPYPTAGFHPPVSRRPPPALPTEFGCGDVNTFLSQIRAADVAGGADPLTHYYGLVFEGAPGQTQLFMRGCAAGIPGTPDPSAPASGPTGASTFGWDDSGSYGGWYTGHELGHTLGRRHVGGTCGEVGTDPDFPFPNGEISGAAASFVGFDPGDATIEPRLSPLAVPGKNIGGRQGHDVMSYCLWQWPSAYSYINVLERILAENALPAAPTPTIAPTEPNPTSMLISGPPSSTPTVSAGQPTPPAAGSTRYVHLLVRLEQDWTSGKIVSVLPARQTSAMSAAQGSAPVIEALAADGRVLATISAPVHIFDEDGPAHDHARGAGLINVTIPTTTDTVAFRIVYGGRVIAETRRDTSPNMITVTAAPMADRPARNVPTAERAMVLTWRGQHAARLPLSYTVQVSADGGTTWQTVAVGLSAPSIEVALKSLSERVRARIASGQPLKYKVIASDGFNATELVDDVR